MNPKISVTVISVPELGERFKRIQQQTVQQFVSDDD